ncbi:hypothetical protein C8J57DRAFT_1719155 [Mycena rebaudengoi]|nr:hypothetical protein C8J57DRAFT_1719155 [Mycena rebaudengoi]
MTDPAQSPSPPPLHPRTKSFIHNPLAATDPSHTVPDFQLLLQTQSDICIAHPLRPAAAAVVSQTRLALGVAWRGQTTGLGNTVDWRTVVRIRFVALASGTGSVNVTLLRPLLVEGPRVGEPEEVDRRRYLSSQLDSLALVRQGYRRQRRFKRLLNSGSLIFEDRIALWVHHIPVQNDCSDLLDTLIFFRGDPSGFRALIRPSR